MGSVNAVYLPETYANALVILTKLGGATLPLDLRQCTPLKYRRECQIRIENGLRHEGYHLSPLSESCHRGIADLEAQMPSAAACL